MRLWLDFLFTLPLMFWFFAALFFVWAVGYFLEKYAKKLDARLHSNESIFVHPVHIVHKTPSPGGRKWWLN
jgi:hypothetical protein